MSVLLFTISTWGRWKTNEYQAMTTILGKQIQTAKQTSCVLLK